ncbi:MAG: hypothetical protein M1818_008430 [Claussenomyces sp. TS43310]|nr:MAG: hypothetical protein M1818_008430 [Claussenomyces sp. TS43310]
MASHQLAIAKASFSAGLLRPDPVSISRDEIAHFHTLLNAVSTECSSANIQQCKRWIIANVAQSAARLTAFGKYLLAFSASCAGSSSTNSATSMKFPSAKRRRLYLLYLVHDILHYAKTHLKDDSMASKIQPILLSLFGSAATFKNCPKHLQKIGILLDIWEERSYYGTDYVLKLREAVTNAAEKGCSTAVSNGSDRSDDALAEKRYQNVPFVLPAMHGDLNTAWFDLPAGNLIPHIVPGSTRPINPAMVKPLQLVSGPADDGLVTVVTDFLQDVEKLFEMELEGNPFDNAKWDIDPLGQLVINDDITGESLGGEAYYGWSKQFCDGMRGRRKGLDQRGEHRRSRRRSGSSSRSSHAYKRRRYSDSVENLSRSRGRSRSKHGSRGSSSSRSRSPSGAWRMGSRRNGGIGAQPENDSRSIAQEENAFARDKFSDRSPASLNMTETMMLDSSTPAPWASRAMQGPRDNTPYSHGHRALTRPELVVPPDSSGGTSQWPPPPPLLPPPPPEIGLWARQSAPSTNSSLGSLHWQPQTHAQYPSPQIIPNAWPSRQQQQQQPQQYNLRHGDDSHEPEWQGGGQQQYPGGGKGLGPRSDFNGHYAQIGHTRGRGG